MLLLSRKKDLSIVKLTRICARDSGRTLRTILFIPFSCAANVMNQTLHHPLEHHDLIEGGTVDLQEFANLSPVPTKSSTKTMCLIFFSRIDSNRGVSSTYFGKSRSRFFRECAIRPALSFGNLCSLSLLNLWIKGFATGKIATAALPSFSAISSSNPLTEFCSQVSNSSKLT